MSKLSDSGNQKSIEVISGVQRHRRWTAFEKLEMVKQTYELGNLFPMLRVNMMCKSGLFRQLRENVGLLKLK